MKISVTDKQGSGIMLEFARAIGAIIDGRFIRIPESKGAGYITGFSWGTELRMMLRNYYLNEEILIDRTNELAEGQDYVIFLLSGIFPSPLKAEHGMQPEQANVFICRQAISSLLTMPSNTFFRSITIAVSREYLRQVFGNILHPVVASILQAKEQFAFETVISPEMVKTASEMLNQSMPESMESHYYKLKCEELLCYIFTLLAQREASPTSGMHIEDIKAIYAVKLRLQSKLDSPPDIASLAREAAMSEPKLRKLFRQTFGKGVFEYYQSMRMQEAARLLKENRLTVSEVGYQLGFTNLSHFSRVFEQHTGMKPKKYSVQLQH
ncbi:AraC family transcriptional regulator [Pedobacter metabolipauper]|uniref:AraC family transcriptional regulator n=1 Tax=Pedobacter metabolipauper TaxID=425513 RepID=A0A4R6T1K1_9SPHI|nr:AraC family transcriptional regulator [Pedobacter metabolipauper]TDQ11211.1 AraC family transcriptional regulator [Pedobacter metabolipauper]